MEGFIGCHVGDDVVARRLIDAMSASARSPAAPATIIGERCAYIGEKDAGGAREGKDWVVVCGFTRDDAGRLLDGARLLRLLRAQGPRAVGALTGEFALAACVGGKTFVARDRYGARPVYFGALPRGGHAFASAMRPLLAAGVPGEVDRGAVVSSLVFGYASPPATSLACVRQVAPGEIVRFGSRVERHRYYEPRERCDRRRTLPTAARMLDRAVTAAVTRAPARGRVGAFLSGGLDSSLVAARLCEIGHRIETYTLHFGDHLPSEIRYARAVARHLGVRHHVLDLDARRFCDAIEPALFHLEDLLSEPIAVPNFLLAREAARTRDVLFTGEGGDPLFGGPKNIGMVLERMYGARPLGAAYASAHHHLADDLADALTPEWLDAFRAERAEHGIQARLARRRRGETYVGQLMVTNLALKGGGNILVKAAKMIGAHGVALRSPLFDPAVIELALTIPPWQKLHGTEEKIVLKRAAARSLPEAVVYRPKRGMGVPLRAWLDGALGELAHDVLTPATVRERGIFRWEYVRRLLRLDRLPHDLARSRTAEKLWLVLITELHQRALARLGQARS